MTVSSFVALLDEQNVLVKTQRSLDVVTRVRPPLGRRVQWVELAGERCGWVVINLTSLSFSALSLRLNAEPYGDEVVHEYDKTLSYERNLADFLARISEMEGIGDALGVAVITPGPYDVETDTVRNVRIPELNAIHIKEALRAAFPFRNIFVEEDVKLSIRAFLPRADRRHGDVLAYLYLGEGVGGAIAYQGDVLRGRNAVAGDFGQTLATSGTSYENELTVNAFASRFFADGAARADELIAQMDVHELDDQKKAAYDCHAEILSQLIRNIMWSVDPTRIVIECPYAHNPCDAEYFSERTLCSLKARLSGSMLNLPEIQLARTDQPSVLYGAVQALSWQWIDGIVTGGREETAEETIQEAIP